MFRIVVSVNKDVVPIMLTDNKRVTSIFVNVIKDWGRHLQIQI